MVQRNDRETERQKERKTEKEKDRKEETIIKKKLTQIGLSNVDLKAADVLRSLKLRVSSEWA